MYEIWKSLKHDQIIDGYSVSSYGRIQYKNNDPYEPEYHSTNGYDFGLFVLKNEYVDRYKPLRLFPIDELVGLTFIPIPDELTGHPIKIEHINGDTRDSYLSNLKWTEDVEVWKPCKYNGVKLDMYEVSSYGRVKNKITGKILKQTINRDTGRCNISLMLETPKNGKTQFPFKIHRLVANEFLNKTGTNVVNHINGLPWINHHKNLEYTTNGQNIAHAYMTGLHKPKSFFDDETVHFICKLMLDYNGSIPDVIKVLSERGFAKSVQDNVRNIKYGLTHRDISVLYWDDGRFSPRTIAKRLSDEESGYVKKVLSNYDGSVAKTLQYLKSIGSDITRSQLQHIKYNKM